MSIQEPKILNLEQALELCSLLSSYLDDTKEENDSVSFIGYLLDKLPPMEYLKCVVLLTGTPSHEIQKEDSLDAVTAFVEGLSMNQILSMNSLMKRIGFI